METLKTPVDQSNRQGLSPLEAGPRWFDSLINGALIVVMAWMGAALLLAMIGWFRVWTVVPATVAIAFALVRFLPSPSSRPATGRLAAGAYVIAVAIALAAIAGNLWFHSEHVLTGRDPATYANTAQWIASNGGLRVDARPGPFADAPELGVDAFGFQGFGDDATLYPQFLHVLPALMATAGSLFGTSGLFSANAVLGGLALLVFFAFASRFMAAWWALVAMAALGLSMVFAYFTRSPFSEPLALLVAFGGMWMLHRALDHRDGRLWFAAGLLVGSSFLVRIDGLLIVLGVAAFLELYRYADDGDAARRRSVTACNAGIYSVLALALLDLALFSPLYLKFHGDKIIMLAAALLVMRILGDLAVRGWFDRGFELLRRHRHQVAVVAAAVILLGFVYGLFLRPHLQQGHADYPYRLEMVQERDGLEVDPTRTYEELSVRWLVWYLGFVGVMLGMAGWAYASYQTIRRGLWRLAPFLLVFTFGTVLYLARPFINPDHIWVMRRFLPVTIPGLLFLAAALLAVLWAKAREWSAGTLLRASTIVLAAVMVAEPAAVHSSVFSHREMEGQTATFTDFCGRLGEDAAVVVLAPGEVREAGRVLTQPVRSFCGLPIAYAEHPPPPDRVDDLAAAWAAQGRRLLILGEDPLALRPFSNTEPEVLGTIRWMQLDKRLTGPPSDAGLVTRTFYGVTVG